MNAAILRNRMNQSEQRPLRGVKVILTQNAGGAAFEGLSNADGLIDIREAPTANLSTPAKFFNAVVNIAKYGHNIADNIIVKVIPATALGAASTITTYGYDVEVWNMGNPSTAPIPNFVPELTMGSEITDLDKLPSLPLPTNNSGTPQPKSVNSLFTVKNVLIGLVVIGVLVAVFYPKTFSKDVKKVKAVV
jgi:hypothetical protein